MASAFTQPYLPPVYMYVYICVYQVLYTSTPVFLMVDERQTSADDVNFAGRREFIELCPRMCNFET